MKVDAKTAQASLSGADDGTADDSKNGHKDSEDAKDDHDDQNEGSDG